MNINELNDTIKKKISEGIIIDEILIEDKTYLHLKHKNFQKNKYHLKITIKSKELSAMSKIESTKKIYQILSFELKNIIQYANRNKILLIGIVSKKDSTLYKAADIKLLTPQVKESGGIIPTSSTTVQLALGDALAISAMKQKNFNKIDFKKLHPAGTLGAKLKTVEDIMLTGKKIPFVDESLKMKNALKILSDKNLGVLIVQIGRASCRERV